LSNFRVPQECPKSTPRELYEYPRTHAHAPLRMQAMNARSSRSHTVFQIIIEQKQKLKGANADGLEVKYPWSTPRVPLDYPLSTP
jgi:hypothetical protein